MNRNGSAGHVHDIQLRVSLFWGHNFKVGRIIYVPWDYSPKATFADTVTHYVQELASAECIFLEVEEKTRGKRVQVNAVDHCINCGENGDVLAVFLSDLVRETYKIEEFPELPEGVSQLLVSTVSVVVANISLSDVNSRHIAEELGVDLDDEDWEDED